MSQDNLLFLEFLRVAGYLNSKLHIVPVLFGSLGLQVVSGVLLNPQDIDLLVPAEWLQSGWSTLKAALEELGYQLMDPHEHEFRKGEFTIAFAFEEDLFPFANVDYKRLEQVKVGGSAYRQLSLNEYHRVYSASLTDGYRRIKNNNKDLQKIELLTKLLAERDDTFRN